MTTTAPNGENVLNIFISETKEPFERKSDLNVLHMVLYKNYVFFKLMKNQRWSPLQKVKQNGNVQKIDFRILYVLSSASGPNDNKAFQNKIKLNWII